MIDVIDLRFQGLPGLIASYVLHGPGGAVIVETGPASTYPALLAGLDVLGLEPGQVTDILLTHIHLDHAGAAGWLARRTGATVHVHHVGAPHMVDPSRLLASAGRIYGDQMGPLWGETRPVPASQVRALQDGDVIEAAGLRFHALDTPGHATHHMAYLWDGLCFTGDVAAVRLPGQSHIRVPTPPPEINLPAWHDSLARLQELQPDRLLPTHYGPVLGDSRHHLRDVARSLDAAADFVRACWLRGEPAEAIVEAFTAWVVAQATADGCDADARRRYEVIVPSAMVVQGLLRYLRKAKQHSP